MTVLIGVSVVHSVLFLAAAVVVLKSQGAGKGQKWLQVFFSLLLPVLGPLITVAVYWTDKAKRDKPSDRYIGQSIDQSSVSIADPPDS